MIRKTIFAAASLLASLSLVHAPAAAANLNIKDGNATAQVLCAKVLSDGSLAECHVTLDTTLTQIDPATKQLQQAEIAALGSLLQAGGNVAVTGSLPAFAATPTFNLGTLNGAATSAAQATNTSAITATQAATGSIAATAQTVTTTLPQITATPGLAVSYSSTAATLFNANASRHFMVIQVQGAPDTTGSTGCYINAVGAATADANSLYIPRGGYYESATHVGAGAVSIICTATMAVYSRQG